ncbi:MAG: divalent-cation tolerance protein CutA [Candidatus Bathyarchaeia archaeon]|jgi:periplasmic divalent cation tolerance protein
MKQYVHIFTTTRKREDAEKVARTLVEKRLAGCVQIIGPIQSMYWWKNRKETAEEWLCLIKSEKSLYKELEKTIKETHPYKTPEITAVPIVAARANGLVTNSRDNLAGSYCHSQQQPLEERILTRNWKIERAENKAHSGTLPTD